MHNYDDRRQLNVLQYTAKTTVPVDSVLFQLVHLSSLLFFVQSPVLPLAGGSGGVVGVEVSSASGESEGEEGGMEEEEMLPSLLLRPLSHKHRRVEQDFSALMDQ